ncbi:MAG: isoleucyl-tRNA synthetase [Actinomycetota bacterium]|nr:isoleucyl-tRNA synthetase [Actinomycetota bacterium]
MYRPVPARIDLPAMETEIIARWQSEDIFGRSLAATRDGQPWVFYEGPPTANGMPGTHHIEARVFKDVFPRFKTMQGRFVPRKAGWDCHGLPVELAVEKELGFSGKGDIEAYGIEQFNVKCRESVLRHVSEFGAMTERMGYWVDMDDAYWTMSSDYIESVWWSLAQIHRAGLLVQDHRVSPYCPRCGTTLSDHELAQGYEVVTDPSVFIRMPVTGGPLAERFPGIALLVWTTTPWTLVSNTAVAVSPTADYSVIRTAEGETLIVAEALREKVAPDSEVLATMAGADLEHTGYTPPFDLVDVPQAHYVILGDYVTTEDGSGLVHIAPAFGADDLVVARGYDLPVINPVHADGTFDPEVPMVGGMFFKDADPVLVDDVRERGLLYLKLDYEHNYPHCWRCHTPLLYYAQPSWYIRTTAIKDRLLRENAATNWIPETIRDGRFGDWLANNIDWALSRNRYWGTPLPLWRCEADHVTAIESLLDLSDKAGVDLAGLDPHRPFVDDVVIRCDVCGEPATRVPEVIDCWYDSGAMPFAQFGYPHHNVDLFKARYPADFVCEAIDQTRGWFYTLMAIGTLVFDESSYRNVLCLGHILDAQGRKMSKHLGNVLEPIGLMDAHGADAVRWFMLASGSPWQARRVSHEAIDDVVRRVLLTYWNTVSFQSLYGRTAGWDPSAGRGDAPLTSLDRWALSEASRAVAEVTAALEVFDTQTAGRVLTTFIDDLSNWYVRRSRRRFWAGDPAALATLHECLRTITLLMAPFTPFITERVWSDLFAEETGIDSVHLASWPEPDVDAIDPQLRADVATVRTLVDLGRSARAESGVRTRQPLGRALVASTRWDSLPADLRAQFTDEVNVLSAVPLSTEGADLVEVSVKTNFRDLGNRYGKQTPVVAAALAQVPAAEVAASLRDAGSVMVTVADDEHHLAADEVIITERPLAGWSVASTDGATVALDLELTDDLRSLGIAREVVRGLQEARKNAGFDVTDRITVVYRTADDAVAQSLRSHGATIADEVLAVSFTAGEPHQDAVELTDPQVTFQLNRA